MSTDTTPLTDDLHSAMCRAVASLNEGREQEASAVLRQALVDYADAIAATPKAPDPRRYGWTSIGMVEDAEGEFIEAAQRPAEPALPPQQQPDLLWQQRAGTTQGPPAARSVEEPKPALGHPTERASAAVQRPAFDERREFEATMRSCSTLSFERDEGGYKRSAVDAAWIAWQIRADLELEPGSRGLAALRSPAPSVSPEPHPK